MSSPLRAVTDEVRSEYGLFIVTELIDGRLAGAAAEGAIEPPDDRVAAGDDGLIIQAAYAGAMHAVHMRIELWDGAPPADPWEELWAGRLLLKSRLVGVGDWVPGHPPQVEFDLGQSDRNWSARVSTKILQTEQDPDFPYAIARMELYKVQFWS
ncbi:hypothetical protein GCM10010156_51920 [Planobispora rosea]|uniref:Uncharacterized protein n=1 Tax=Planobispora rosea TaxID=35762 RepID=A0A8J3S4D4_PLARO|nr:hypothetical protein [Planobispora rosea]GGS87070.1 hypothetical protein GCM10010156_51920 [Planobispora rosea]GIH86594.1 hypothetical protein Pro02_50020 [Planobispora rosea]